MTLENEFGWNDGITLRPEEVLVDSIVGASSDAVKPLSVYQQRRNFLCESYLDVGTLRQRAKSNGLSIHKTAKQAGVIKKLFFYPQGLTEVVRSKCSIVRFVRRKNGHYGLCNLEEGGLQDTLDKWEKWRPAGGPKPERGR